MKSVKASGCKLFPRIQRIRADDESEGRTFESFRARQTAPFGIKLRTVAFRPNTASCGPKKLTNISTIRFPARHERRAELLTHWMRRALQDASVGVRINAISIRRRDGAALRGA